MVQSPGCGLSERSDILQLCRGTAVALGVGKQCKGDAAWHCQGLDWLS